MGGSTGSRISWTIPLGGEGIPILQFSKDTLDGRRSDSTGDIGGAKVERAEALDCE